MKSALVCLVSDQTIPVVLSVKSQAGSFNDLYLVTTESMRKKGKLDAVLSVIRDMIRNTVNIILDREDNIAHLIEKMKGHNWDDYEKVTADITLGTKLMSLGVYQFFYNRAMNNKNIRIIYQTVNKNSFQEIYPLNDKETVFEFCLSLEQYLKANGVEIKNKQENLTVSPEITENLLREHVKYKDTAELMRFCRNAKNLKYKSDRTYSLDDLAGKILIINDGNEKIYTADELNRIRDFMKACEINPGQYMKKHVEYLTGGWLEECFYSRVLKLSGQPVECAGLSVNIENHSKSENELDMALINSKNQFLYAECKTSVVKKDGHSLLTDAIYKQAAIKKDFGLSAKAVFVTLDNIEKEKERNRASDQNIILIDGHVIHDESLFNDSVGKWIS